MDNKIRISYVPVNAAIKLFVNNLLARSNFVQD